ncbi:hypothetical protein CBR_g37828 [Chara braunii]|uniref:Neprosin PEP catalytic domain-containing protein n=1 Tax=Chara braunii TaxID=69332 RepID=A0A388LNN3_CHABU|nr:hypothetical protein CBR_g37828 [Chara braunii]|eukprot:GBG83956.1 hypothetical protein CBR_g37828 [Chara braunii]
MGTHGDAVGATPVLIMRKQRWALAIAVMVVAVQMLGVPAAARQLPGGRGNGPARSGRSWRVAEVRDCEGANLAHVITRPSVVLNSVCSFLQCVSDGYQLGTTRKPCFQFLPSNANVDIGGQVGQRICGSAAEVWVPSHCCCDGGRGLPHRGNADGKQHQNQKTTRSRLLQLLTGMVADPTIRTRTRLFTRFSFEKHLGDFCLLCPHPRPSLRKLSSDPGNGRASPLRRLLGDLRRGGIHDQIFSTSPPPSLLPQPATASSSSKGVPGQVPLVLPAGGAARGRLRHILDPQERDEVASIMSYVKSMSYEYKYTFMNREGDTIDCVAIQDQPSLRHSVLQGHTVIDLEPQNAPPLGWSLYPHIPPGSGSTPSLLPLWPPRAGGDHDAQASMASGAIRNETAAGSINETQATATDEGEPPESEDQSVDAAASCPEGTIPVRRMTVAEVLRLKSLRNFRQKYGPLDAREGPLGAGDSHRARMGPSPSPGLVFSSNRRGHARRTAHVQQSSSPHQPRSMDAAVSGEGKGHHEYATVQRYGQRNIGAKVVLNLWQPNVEGDSEFSLSQMWVTSGSYDSGTLNTMEVGWQVFPAKYGDREVRLFIYHTRDAYKETGCYNLDCTGFVQTNKNIVLGGPVGSTSEPKGKQKEIAVMWWLEPETGKWWLQVGKQWVGYFPRDWFSTLEGGADHIGFGGEVVDLELLGRHTSTEMGSGVFPRGKDSFGKVAYQRNLEYIDMNNAYKSISSVSEIITNRACYELETFKDNSDWGFHFFFGGPGYTKNGTCK